MDLLPGEQILVYADEEKVVLTTHRVVVIKYGWTRRFVSTVFLEEISTIGVKYKAEIFSLVMSGIVFLTGWLNYLQTGNADQVRGGAFIASLFFISWLVFRDKILSISARSGSRLEFVLEKLAKKDIDDFIYKVSLAREERLKQLNAK